MTPSLSVDDGVVIDAVANVRDAIVTERDSAFVDSFGVTSNDELVDDAVGDNTE